MITCPNCNHSFEGPAGNPVPHVANKPYVGRLFFLKNMSRIPARVGNMRAKINYIKRDVLPEAAMILDEKGTLLCIADASNTLYWIKRSYFFKEAI